MIKRIGSDLFRGVSFTPPDKSQVVHVIDVDDTLTRKPDGFDNTGLTKDQFFDAARDFPAQRAVVELTQLLHRMGDAIAIATARPIERLEETIHWLRQHNVPFDTIMLSLGSEPSSISKQAMLQKLQKDYLRIGVLIDDSIYNVEGARLQGVSAIHLRTNDQYWLENPEQVYAYGL
jgi:phosphoglycolate phosphatase-like HAD superfamily hydrolase